MLDKYRHSGRLGCFSFLTVENLGFQSSGKSDYPQLVAVWKTSKNIGKLICKNNAKIH